MTNLERARINARQAAADMETARAAVAAVQVPDSDLDTGAEPTTVTGWYHQPTVSGRPAWQYRNWHAGQVRAQRPVYDRGPVERLASVAERDYSAQRDLEMELRSPWRDTAET